ncbi:MAG: DUF3793 family protein [Thermotaleaceae bacterium]
MKKTIDNCFCLQEGSVEFETWLVEILGPVLMGVKPAEILSFSSKGEGNQRKVEIIHRIFSNHTKIRYQKISYRDICTKFIFYHPEALDRVLKESRNQRFLQSIGYHRLYSREMYLRILEEKIAGGEIPDEIGIFLGYPLKDVIGFMGHPSLRLTKINGWRIYGDTRLSDEIYISFVHARKQVREMLGSNSPSQILLALS